MTERWEEHYRLVGPESWRIISCALRALDEEALSYVLIGGWALYAYGSAVPSIDTDLFLETKDFTRLTRIMRIDERRRREFDDDQGDESRPSKDSRAG